MGGMKYSLRTLLILMAIMPPLLAASLPAMRRLIRPQPPKLLLLRSGSDTGCMIPIGTRIEGPEIHPGELVRELQRQHESRRSD